MKRMTQMWMILVVINLHLFLATKVDAAHSVWGVGCPIGKISVFLNDGSDVESGYVYDINYTLKYNRLLNLEVGLGMYLTQSPILPQDYNNDDTTLTGNITLLTVMDEIYLLSKNNHQIYTGLGLEYAHMELDFQSCYDFLFLEHQSNIDNFKVERIHTVGFRAILGYEYKINETLSFLFETGYRYQEFCFFAKWYDKALEIKRSEHSDDLTNASYLVSFGLKAFFPL